MTWLGDGMAHIWQCLCIESSSISVVYTEDELDPMEKQFLSDAAEKEDTSKFDVDMGGQVSGIKSTIRQVGSFRNFTYRIEGLITIQNFRILASKMTELWMF